MKLNLKCFGLAFIISAGLSAQNGSDDLFVKKACGTTAPSAEWDNWFNQKVEQHKQGLIASKTQSTTYVIPVIVHVIYGALSTNVGIYPNISQVQVQSQISVLNADFAGTGVNVNNLAATAFSAVGAANCNISFCLAQLDPDGNYLTEPGIDRISYVDKGWNNPASSAYNNSGSFQSYMDGTIKPATIWDPKRYFNIWVSDVNSGAQLLGYATFPAGSGLTGLIGTGNSSSDGIWVWSKAFGNTGTLQSPYNLGRTASHETGHWLGLRHIGGDGNGNVNGDCAATDYCTDTPPQKGGFASGQYGQNFGAPTYPLYATGVRSCTAAPNGCMFMNFMDYVDDPYCYMFTPDQSTRMTTAMTNGTYRKDLTASSATMCGLPATLPTAAFTMTNLVCESLSVDVLNQSTATPPPSYIWSILPSSAGVTFSVNNASANPSIKFSLAGNYTVVLNATNAAGTHSVSKPVTVVFCDDVSVPKITTFQKSISLMPNPSNGLVGITTSLTDIKELKVEVHNYLGQLITQIAYDPSIASVYTLDLSSYPGGIYTVTVHNGVDKAVKRLVLNK